MLHERLYTYRSTTIDMDMGYEYDTARLTQVRACVMVVPRVVVVSHASITPPNAYQSHHRSGEEP